MTRPESEHSDDDPPSTALDKPAPNESVDDENWHILEGEYTEHPPDQEDPFQYDPTVAPLAPRPRSMGAVEFAGALLLALLVLAGIWFAATLDWPVAIPLVVLAVALALVAIRLGRGPVQEAEYKAALSAAEPILYPSSRVEHVLSPGERLYIEAREHPLSTAPWILAASVATVAAGWWMARTGQWQAAGIGWGVTVLFCLYRMAMWERRIFCVTDRYVILIEGVFTTHENRMHIVKVTDAKKIVPWHSKVLAWLRIINLSYGTFELETAGQDQAINKVGWLPGINQLTRITMALASGNRPDLPPDS